MAAKVATRKKNEKVEEEGPKVLYAVINKASRRRVYVGRGVREEDAKRLAEGLVEPAYIVPVDELDVYGCHRPKASEPADEPLPEAA